MTPVAEEILRREPLIRLSVFLGLLALMTLWERVAERRERSVPRTWRWPNNFGVAALDTLVGRIIAPTGAVGFALFAEAHGLGCFHHLGWPAWLEVVAAVVAMDLAIYLQHRVFHYVPVLWRLHRMHHADLDVDVTTGARFHPLEILMSLGIEQFRDPKELRLDRMLTQPFRDERFGSNESSTTV